jgi:hypothetical protein
VTAGVGVSGSIKNCNAPMAGGAEPPGPGPAIVAIGVSNLDELVNLLPIVGATRAVLIEENGVIVPHRHTDAGNLTVIHSPVPTERAARHQQAVAVHLPDVQR